VEPPHGPDEGLLLDRRRLGALLCIHPSGRQLHKKQIKLLPTKLENDKNPGPEKRKKVLLDN
jgi:hypothetical protein